jgi:putative N-acetyltransferase (TIGR04045 family)
MSATALSDLPSSRDVRVAVVRADGDPRLLTEYAALRRRAFVDEQHLFDGDDEDAADGAPLTRVLVAIDGDRAVLGGVRLHPHGPDAPEHWRGSRLVCSGAGGPSRGLVGALLVREACVQADDAGARFFDAHVQLRHARFFGRLGWEDVRCVHVAGAAHRLMRWPHLQSGIAAPRESR